MSLKDYIAEKHEQRQREKNLRKFKKEMEALRLEKRSVVEGYPKMVHPSLQLLDTWYNHVSDTLTIDFAKDEVKTWAQVIDFFDKYAGLVEKLGVTRLVLENNTIVPPYVFNKLKCIESIQFGPKTTIIGDHALPANKLLTFGQGVESNTCIIPDSVKIFGEGCFNGTGIYKLNLDGRSLESSNLVLAIAKLKELANVLDRTTELYEANMQERMQYVADLRAFNSSCEVFAKSKEGRNPRGLWINNPSNYDRFILNCRTNNIELKELKQCPYIFEFEVFGLRNDNGDTIIPECVKNSAFIHDVLENCKVLYTEDCKSFINSLISYAELDNYESQNILPLKLVYNEASEFIAHALTHYAIESRDLKDRFLSDPLELTPSVYGLKCASLIAIHNAGDKDKKYMLAKASEGSLWNSAEVVRSYVKEVESNATRKYNCIWGLNCDIPAKAFEGSQKLNNFYVDRYEGYNSKMRIGSSAFKGSSIAKFDCEDAKVEFNFGDQSFENCKNLQMISIVGPYTYGRNAFPEEEVKFDGSIQDLNREAEEDFVK